MDYTRALEQARRDAIDLADRRVRAMQRRIRADGAEDRAVLGIVDPPYVSPWERMRRGVAAMWRAFGPGSVF